MCKALRRLAGGGTMDVALREIAKGEGRFSRDAMPTSPDPERGCGNGPFYLLVVRLLFWIAAGAFLIWWVAQYP